MASMDKIRTDNYNIHSYEIDATGRLTLPNLGRYMQESAWKHAEHLGVGFSSLIKRNLVWVLAQQRIRIIKYPRWGEQVRIQTWPSAMDKRFYYRDFSILVGGEEVGTATTAWVVLDVKARRRADIQLDLNIDYNSMERVFTDRPQPVLALQKADWSSRLNVRYGDLDVNDHVNNVKYIEWILEGFDREFHRERQVADITVNYLAEARYGDEITIDHQKNTASDYLHSLRNFNGQKELCRARTSWMKR